MRVRTVLLIVTSLVLVSHVWPDDIVPPAPTGYSWSSWGWYAGERPYVEVFPPGSRNNPTDKPVAFFYIVPEPGRKFDVKAKFVWSGPLANKWMPAEVLVPPAGNGIVTLNDYGNRGYLNCVVIYDGRGRLLRSYAITDLFSDDVIATIPASVSNRAWNEPTRYTISENSRYLYIWTLSEVNTGKIHRFDLKTGDMAKVPGTDTASPKHDEIRVFPYPLRFSALTDILKPRLPSTRREAE